MPLTLTPVAVTDEDGAVQQYHIREACGEECNLDAAREAGHLVTVDWPDVFDSAIERYAAGDLVERDGEPGVNVARASYRAFLCDRAFGLGDG